MPHEHPAQQNTEGAANALEKFHCPACGADAHWNPSHHALICPYCGTEFPAALVTRGSETVIVEHDLAEALRGIPDDARGWQAEKDIRALPELQRNLCVDLDKIGQRCDFCGASQLVPYAEVKDPFRPESLLALQITESQARDLIRNWYRRQWLAPNKLRSAALTDTVRGVYLPYWTFDANAHALWTAESGEYYTAYQGNKRVRRVKWAHASGELSHTFDDALVPASRGVNAQWLQGVEPFPTNALIPYDPGYLAGWTVERYQIDLVSAAARSRQQMEAELRALCASQVPGDTYRNLEVRATFSDQRFKHVLVPVWLLTYVYGATSYQVVINGVTGKVAGGHPWSWIKIVLLGFLGLILLYLTILANQ